MLETVNQENGNEQQTKTFTQVEVAVKGNGGPNRPPLKSWRMTCG